MGKNVTLNSVTIQFAASSPKADMYRVEYRIFQGYGVDLGRWYRGVTVLDTSKDRYTVTQGQLIPFTSYRLRVVPYTAGRRGRASYPLSIRTSSKYVSKIIFSCF